MSPTVKAGRREIPVSSADRVVFDGAGLTKLDLARYYADVAGAMVPHVRDRPLALHTFPKGVERRRATSPRTSRATSPTGSPRCDVPKREGGTIRQVLANDAATLVYLAGQNAITLHIWTSRADRLERPDRLVFDLDPTVQDFAEVRAAAREAGDAAARHRARAVHDDDGLARAARRRAAAAARPTTRRCTSSAGPWPTASRPSTRTADERVPPREARRPHLPRHEPQRLRPARDRAVLPARAAGRAGGDAAAVGRAGRPKLDPQGWSITTVLERLADRGGDPWAGIARDARALGGPRKALG